MVELRNGIGNEAPAPFKVAEPVPVGAAVGVDVEDDDADGLAVGVGDSAGAERYEYATTLPIMMTIATIAATIYIVFIFNPRFIYITQLGYMTDPHNLYSLYRHPFCIKR